MIRISLFFPPFCSVVLSQPTELTCESYLYFFFLHWWAKVIQKIRKAEGSISIITHNSRGIFSDLAELP